MIYGSLGSSLIRFTADMRRTHWILIGLDIMSPCKVDRLRQKPKHSAGSEDEDVSIIFIHYHKQQ